MHLILMTRGIHNEVELWKNLMQAQMWRWSRVALAKDKDGNYIPDGEDEYGTPKYKHETYSEDQVDKETGRVLHKKGDEVNQIKLLQGALRPIQLWEYVLPTESLPELLAAMNQHHGAGLRPEMKPVAWMLRKGMGAKPVPNFPELYGKKSEELTGRFIKNDAVAVYPIGIKADKKKDFIFKLPGGVSEGWYQEGV